MQKSKLDFVKQLAELLAHLGGMKEQAKAAQKLKLIIHGGTPKTGTTSLQSYLDKKQRKLRGKGILYPHARDNLKNLTAPRHQWLEKNLVSTNLQSLFDNFEHLLSQVKTDTHTIILSTEGLYNCWWDFPEASKSVLSELAKLFDLELWVWFREPLGFIESYYKQCIRNPQVESNPCYGNDLSFAEMLNIPWFAKHLDYQGFVDESQGVFGENKVCVFNYQGDVVQEVIQKLGLATAHDNPTPRQNSSLNSASIKLLRTINHYQLKAKDKGLLIAHVKEINEILGPYAKDSLIDEASRKRVLALSRPIIF